MVPRVFVPGSSIRWRQLIDGERQLLSERR